MFKITHKQIINQEIKRIDITAPTIAQKAKPGQFVMVMPRATSERIPFTIVDADDRKGTISLIVHEVGPASRQLGAMSINDEIALVQGPLGQPATVGKYGTVVCIATGIGAAQILPVGRALKRAGNKVYGIVGAKTKKAMMLESQMRVVCDEIVITTNDGSYERKGLATDVLRALLDKQTINMVYAIGSVDMMQAVCRMTQPKGIATRVTLNPTMLSGLGICGSCRVKVGGQIRMACVDGPEFDGHEVDYEDLSVRMNTVKESEAWGNLTYPRSPKNGASAILTKFLSGIKKS